MQIENSVCVCVYIYICIYIYSLILLSFLSYFPSIFYFYSLQDILISLLMLLLNMFSLLS